MISVGSSNWRCFMVGSPTSPTSGIKISHPKRQPVTVRQNRPLGRPPDHRRYFPVMLLYNNVAGLRQIRGVADRAVAIPHQACREPAVASIAAAEDLNIEVSDLLPQRVSVDPEQVGGPDLVSPGGREGHRQQRVLDLPQDAVIEAGRWQFLPEAREIVSQMPFHGARKPLFCPRLVVP